MIVPHVLLLARIDTKPIFLAIRYAEGKLANLVGGERNDSVGQSGAHREIILAVPGSMRILQSGHVCVFIQTNISFLVTSPTYSVLIKIIFLDLPWQTPSHEDLKRTVWRQ